MPPWSITNTRGMSNPPAFPGDQCTYDAAICPQSNKTGTVTLCEAAYCATLSGVSGGFTMDKMDTLPAYFAATSSRILENAAQCGQVVCMNSTMRILPW